MDECDRLHVSDVSELCSEHVARAHNSLAGQCCADVRGHAGHRRTVRLVAAQAQLYRHNRLEFYIYIYIYVRRIYSQI